MLPIATMAITSFFLSLGGAVLSSSSKTGQAFQSIAMPILQAFPLLICISFALAFTKENQGIAVWCAIISFLTFIYLQSAFISCSGEECKCSCKDKATGCCADGKCSCLLPCCMKNYTVFFFHKDSITNNAIQKFFGITSLNGSIFPAIIIGGVIIPFLFRRYSEIKLPTYLSYFGGKRLLPLLSCLAVVPLAFLFLVFWPWINYGLGVAGNAIAESKGADAFFFGFLEKALIPTGFHHMFASLFWYTPLGGDMYLSNGSGETLKKLCCSGSEGKCLCLSSAHLANSLQWQGDALIGMSALSLPNNEIFKNIKEHLHIARFTQGKFPIMQFALPAAALAIYLASKREKRKEQGKVLFPGIWNSIILGITEPIEFSFMYKLPKLFYLFHTTMCGVSFLCMKLLGAHIPTAFSGGIIELIINGVISVEKGTEFWWWSVVGSGLAVVYFLVFYLSFRWHNKNTQKSGEEIQIEEEVDNNQEELGDTQEKGEINEHLPPQIASFKKGLGGWDNVTNYKNCASRLRYDIQDKSKVIESELTKAGVIAIKWVSDNHVQLIVGPKAEEINSNLLKYKAEEEARLNTSES